MSRSAVVDQRYRLQPADLAGSQQRAVIRQVSFQGLEEMTPVLHLAGPLTKRLTLDADQRRELIATLRSSLCDDWIGQPIELRPGQRDAAPAILIASPTTPHRVREPVARLRTRTVALWPSLWALLLLAAALVALFWLERSDSLFQQILDWMP